MKRTKEIQTNQTASQGYSWTWLFKDSKPMSMIVKILWKAGAEINFRRKLFSEKINLGRRLISGGNQLWAEKSFCRKRVSAGEDFCRKRVSVGKE